MSLPIGYSALRASQIALDTTANNIANANTPGYHRQVVQFRSRAPVEIDNLFLGAGVDAVRIQRLRNQLVEQALTANVSERAEAAGTLEVLRQIESVFSPGTGSLHDRLQTFFNDFERLDARPNDATQRQIVLRNAVSLANELHSLTTRLATLGNGVAREIDEQVVQVNDQARTIADLNRRIRLAQARGLDANGFLDQRDQLINELAELVEAIPVEQGENHPVVLLGDGTALIGEQPPVLEVTTDDAGRIAVTQTGWDRTVRLDSGRLGALISAHNDLIVDFQSRLDLLATSLMGAMDSIHATGLGTAGAFEVLHGQRSVADVTVPLAELESQFAIRTGQLSVSITDVTTGERRSFAIDIDPTVQSLQDLATALSGIHHLQAVVDTQAGSLTILAEPGFTFDFAGRLETTPDTSSVTGTSQARLSGTYTGAANDEYVFQALSGGTVGVTDGLTVQVRNSANQVVTTLDVGRDYEPGTSIEVAAGVFVSFESGTLNAGDSFSTPVIAAPDTSGILTALGLNTFFSGTSASDISVSPFLLENPDRLALSRSGDPADTANLRRLLDARDATLLARGTQTFEQYLAGLTADIGGRVQDMSIVSENLELLGDNLLAERQALSGVDPNEEMVRLLQFQRSFQAAARLISIVDETIDELLRAVG